MGRDRRRWNYLTPGEVVGSVAFLIVLAVIGTIWVAQAFDDIDLGIGVDDIEQRRASARSDHIPGVSASTCDELVADPLFDRQAELVVAFASPAGSPPDDCRLAVEPSASALDVLEVDTACPAGSSVLVAVVRHRSGAWIVDREQTRRLGVDGCLPDR